MQQGEPRASQGAVQPPGWAPAHRRMWTPDEDRALINAVAQHGIGRWDRIAALVGSRKDWQCCERWRNQLSPQISKEPWRPEEDEIILQCVALHGQRWSRIAKILPGRTGNSIKNRYHILTRRVSRTANSGSEGVTGNDGKATCTGEPYGGPLLVVASTGYQSADVSPSTPRRTVEEQITTNAKPLDCVFGPDASLDGVTPVHAFPTDVLPCVPPPLGAACPAMPQLGCLDPKAAIGCQSTSGKPAALPVPLQQQPAPSEALASLQAPSLFTPTLSTRHAHAGGATGASSSSEAPPSGAPKNASFAFDPGLYPAFSLGAVGGTGGADMAALVQSHLNYTSRAASCADLQAATEQEPPFFPAMLPACVLGACLPQLAEMSAHPCVGLAGGTAGALGVGTGVSAGGRPLLATRACQQLEEASSRPLGPAVAHPCQPPHWQQPPRWQPGAPLGAATEVEEQQPPLLLQHMVRQRQALGHAQWPQAELGALLPPYAAMARTQLPAPCPPHVQLQAGPHSAASPSQAVATPTVLDGSAGSAESIEMAAAPAALAAAAASFFGCPLPPAAARCAGDEQPSPHASDDKGQSARQADEQQAARHAEEAARLARQADEDANMAQLQLMAQLAVLTAVHTGAEVVNPFDHWLTCATRDRLMVVATERLKLYAMLSSRAWPDKAQLVDATATLVSLLAKAEAAPL